MASFFITTVTETTFDGTADATLELHLGFVALCTEFDHDASQETFTGTALLKGAVHYQYYLDQVFLGGSSDTIDLLAQVVTGEWNPAESTGMAVLTAHMTPVPFSPAFGDSILAEFGLSIWAYDTEPQFSAYTGAISGTLTFFTDAGAQLVDSIIGETAPFSIHRDNLCADFGPGF